tara:strand:- start:127521 stop:128225 length:705 start_codon:yes stop_codon:yes gene_type:complete
MNNDIEIDIDKIFDQSNNIKPLTEGLGFHHSLKDEKKVKIKQTSKTLDSELRQRARQMSQNTTNNFGDKATMGDLSAFYETKELETNVPNIVISKEELQKLDAKKVGIDIRLLAFVIDMLFISFIYVSIFAISFFISGLPENIFLSAFFSKSFLIEGLVLYSLIFVFYFSFFDKTAYSTLGKNLMGIRTMAINGKMTYYKSFLRSTLTLINLVTFGIMNILGITDLISASKVTK